MNELSKKIEAILFLSIKPLSVKQLATILSAKDADVQLAVQHLRASYAERAGGVTIVELEGKVQMVTDPSVSDVVSAFLKDETTSELTPASLETLTIIAYRGPVSKEEIELIRGVNCTMIIRNLLIRGLIEEYKPAGDSDLPRYHVTLDFMTFMGLTDVKSLPDYEKLNANEHLQALLEKSETQSS